MQTANFQLTHPTHGPRFYDIHAPIGQALDKQLATHPELPRTGLLYIFILHTSAALTITESHDPDAKTDLENFLNRMAPRADDPRVQYLHTDEGPDDSPSHMKSILLQTSLVVPIEQGKLALGTWQHIFLTEFRDAPQLRKLKLKYRAD